MRNRFEDFMYGRYGNDQFNQFLSVIALAVLVVNLFVKIPFLWMGALGASDLDIFPDAFEKYVPALCGE